MTLSKQARQVLDLIRRDGRVTRMTAMHYGVANLTARIAELRDFGLNIVCKEKLDGNGRRYGTWTEVPLALPMPIVAGMPGVI